MSRVLITGSADGLGRLVAQRLADAGHDVVLHARSEQRARAAREAVPQASAALVGDLASIAATRALAEQANASGRFDAVVHNAGVYLEPRRIETEDGLAHVFAVNTLAPYLLTALIERPARLVYLTSGLHRSGDADLSDLQWQRRRWDAMQAYADSKLHDVLLALAVARRWAGTVSNAVNPGWVPTRMGGAGASGDLELGADTQVWLAVSDDAGARVSGRVLHHREPEPEHPAARDPELQDGLLRECERLTGVGFP